MTQVVEISGTKKSVLNDLHIGLNGVMTDRDGWSVPASYGDKSAEYAAVRDGGAGLIDLSSRGRLSVTGSEAVQFLNGLITNDMKTLEHDHWMPAAFPNVQGRLIAAVRVLRLKDPIDSIPAFIIDTEPVTRDVVLATLNRFTLAGDFRIEDLSVSTSLISVQGKKAAQLVRETLGDEAAALKRYQSLQVDWSGKSLTVMRASHTAEDGFDIFVPSEEASDLWNAFHKAGAESVGFDALEMLRVEAGEARYGIDMDETNVVSEANLDDAVSFTKGCYIGQEIIARIKYRGHVAKKLTGLMFESEVRASRGAKIISIEEKEIGRITSVIFSPHLNRTIAMGYVKYDFLSPGTTVKVSADEQQLSAIICDLPFVRGSWFA
jgi:folate-binding protein YgfZ